MKKTGTDRIAGKKKTSSPKPKASGEKKIEKYKKQSLSPGDDDDDFEALPLDDELNFQLDDFDDFDDDDDDY